jgi:xanthine dehydrogenase accessory factor
LHTAATETLHARQTRGMRWDGPDGSVQALIEFRPPAPELVIIGTGEDAQSLAMLAAPLGFRLRVLGGNAMRLRAFSAPTQVVPARPGPADLPLNADTYVVFLSHDLALDAALLPLALDAAPAYIGLLGPRRRTAKLMTALHAAGRLPAPEQLARLHTPVGLDIGGDDPSEVALAILAQVVACKNGRQGGQFGSGHIPARHTIERCAIGEREQSA